MMMTIYEVKLGSPGVPDRLYTTKWSLISISHVENCMQEQRLYSTEQ